MELFCRELTDYREFRECLKLQDLVFQLSDLDKIPPMMMALFARQSPPIGICIGAFEHTPDGEERLIGLIVGVSTFIPNTLYCMMLGTLPDYQHHGIGILLIRRLREAMIQRNIECLYAVYDPLDAGLGKLYFNLLGVTGIAYEIQSYQTAELAGPSAIPVDNLRIEWMIHHPRCVSRFSHQRE
ncbi:MAG: GNAT family N-acetyltransferase, partial [Candidatus Delongbacteria bacterium]|nr:GNAT family N-acetyltransferase [Candidatus Delongbacteria bacterium]